MRLGKGFPMAPDYDDAQQILALTLFGEIRGGSAIACGHVAAVILNRASHPRWWGKTVVGVCMAPWQFSCWWTKDANHQAMLAVQGDDAAYLKCWEVARQTLAGLAIDGTLHADSYFATNSPRPSWVSRARHTIDDGWHSFYRTLAEDVPHLDDPGTPTHSVQTVDHELRADDLNKLVLDRLHGLEIATSIASQG